MTTAARTSSSSFFVTGGTLPPDASSYVERAADRELLSALLEGEYCYVLNSRQMGKSSLCVRTRERLKEEGVRTVFLDLTKYGGRNLTAEQWYAALLADAGRELGLRSEFLSWWKEKGQEGLGPMQRFFEAHSEVALPALGGPLVVFVDEIDVTLSLPFSTDEFFAGIRQLYVGRATRPELGRLCFCLLGTATPADLIQDTRVSPFNIGKRVEVRDFTAAEAAPLAHGFGESGGKLLERVLYWTGGHPYLTQRLCRAVMESGGRTAADVDRTCTELFLTHTAKESDDNLAFVRNRLLRSEADLAALLDLYRRLRQGNRVADDETNPLTSILKLSGVARVEQGALKVRNRIYEHVFDRTWAEQHMPDAERRRQRQAYRRGVVRTALVSGALVVAFGWLAYSSSKLAIRASRGERDARAATSLAQEEANHAKYLLYVSDMNAIGREWEDGNIAHVRQLLTETKDSPHRGFEWAYWNRVAHSEECTITAARDFASVDFSPDGSNLVTTSVDGSVRIVNPHSGNEIRTIATGPLGGAGTARYSYDGNHIACGLSRGVAKVFDSHTGRVVLVLNGHAGNAFRTVGVAWSPDGKLLATATRTDLLGNPDIGQSRIWIWRTDMGKLVATFDTKSKVTLRGSAFTPDGKTLAAVSSANVAMLLDIQSRRPTISLRHSSVVQGVACSPDGKVIATLSGSLNADHGTVAIWDARTGEISRTMQQGRPGATIRFSRDGRRLVTGSVDGNVTVWSVESGARLLNIHAHEDEVADAVLSPDGHRIATGGADHTAKVWNADVSTGSRTVLTNRSPIWSLALSRDGQRVAIRGFDQTLSVFDRKTGRQAHLLRRIPSNGVPNASNTNLAFSPDSQQLLEACEDGTVRIWDLPTGRQIKRFGKLTSNVDAVGSSAAYSPDGTKIAEAYSSLTKGGTWTEAQILNAESGRPVVTLPLGQRLIVAVAYCPSGREIATFDMEAAHVSSIATHVWDGVTGRQIAVIPGFGGSSFSPDGNRMVGSTRRAREQAIVDLRSGRQLATLKGHGDAILWAEYSPDGKRIVTCGNDRTVRLWDADTGLEVLRLKGHSAAVTCARFTSDGRHILSCSRDGSVRSWDATP